MTTAAAQKLLDKIVGQVFGYQNPLTLEQFMQKFTFDVRLPQPVHDAFDGSVTWAQSTNPTRFVKLKNARELEIGGAGAKTDFLRPARPLNAIEDIMAAWNEINFTTTERFNDSTNVSESDNVYSSENVYRSQDVKTSKNVLFSDGVTGSEFIIAGQRSFSSTFCIRLEDSGNCTNCFNVSWSGNLTNCFFMHDTGDMQDSMFCTNIKGKRFCIANMQYDEAEYKRIRDMAVRWILTT
ncbi:MAG TPA: hypothetical protein VLF91_02360 [Candidatus Saccharimonadales bacterium]|nr:hypothetical protein [Candidatus Saccharimonadales bacterium]